ncbi:MAG: hypothetical protein HC840_23980 [Leptolyngbyaceae cyanobacterium RM2_2_4]|nr:hypothetical protein [Leptolyngbyaceae cyanobacterium SM1_4_3]NJN92240.1 hypothetical protein [Leptolyngbyaceae cyanobacterium SL_5_14]NJO51961.1 hypothetical protein [Leptolyngbyaceae cyanobacterium RM2_2_4]NJO67067.1 hypothetical protein [Leptolyngbyaceae cyanobacterium RM1_405_57]
MNAAEQAINFEVATQIATVVNLFKAEFPDVRADLKPWANDSDTRELVDPDSIDIGFHFPGRSRLFQSRSILIQIRFYRDSLTNSYRAIGVEAAGFDHRGKQWQFSTIQNWDFIGDNCPSADTGEQFKRFCRQIFDLFNPPDLESDA